MSSVTIDQSHAVMTVLATNVDWSALDPNVLQNQIILQPKDTGRRFTAFLKNGGRMLPGNLCVATAPFDPEQFIGKEWKTLSEEQDKRAQYLGEVDFSRAAFLSCLKDGEKFVKGEEKLRRLKDSGRIRYGVTVFMGLWKNHQDNKEDSVLECLYREKGITYIDFFGDVLLSPDGYRFVLYLYRDDDGAWGWGCDWLESDWYVEDVSAVSRQVSQ